MINLGFFHYREKKPQAWAVFDAAKKSFEELVEDTNCLAGLEAMEDASPVKRSFERRYSFPTQFTKLTAEKSASILAVEGAIRQISISELNPKIRELSLKIGQNNVDLLKDELDLLPAMPIDTTVIQNSIHDLIMRLCSGTAPRAAIDILERNAPNLQDPSVLNEDSRPSIVRMQQVVKGMDSTVLTVQGPPGTGKTYVSSRAILSLVDRRCRVAVSSNSHEAIRNLLIGCAQAASEHATRPMILHKGSSRSNTADHPDIEVTTSNSDSGLFEADIVGGTAWLFCRPEMIDQFDYLFVDEAGQVSLANLLGMSQCASNLVLIGDPCQLPQVIQASHPEPANLSCLEWMLGARRLVQPDRGIFLGETWRMHPKLCGYISEQFYEGRLRSNPDTARQAVHVPSLPDAGSYLIPVSHGEPRMQQCYEEAQVIQSVIEHLLKGDWTDRHQSTKPIKSEDIIVVAPFNAQVNLLQQELPDHIRVGTVDKFQGQEAAVALVSMTSSSADETPRGLNFLLSRERINVALSRGKALSLVFACPRLLESSCATTDQIRLVNALCALEIHDFKP